MSTYNKAPDMGQKEGHMQTKMIYRVSLFRYSRKGGGYIHKDYQTYGIAKRVAAEGKTDVQSISLVERWFPTKWDDKPRTQVVDMRGRLPESMPGDEYDIAQFGFPSRESALAQMLIDSQERIEEARGRLKELEERHTKLMVQP